MFAAGKITWETVGKAVLFVINPAYAAYKSGEFIYDGIQSANAKQAAEIAAGIPLAVFGCGGTPSGPRPAPADAAPTPARTHYAKTPVGPCFEKLSTKSFRFACDTFMNGEIASGIKCKEWQVYNYDAQHRVCGNRIFKEIDCKSAEVDLKMGTHCLSDSDPQIGQVREGMRAKSPYFVNAFINDVFSYFHESAKLMGSNDPMKGEFNGNVLKKVIEHCYTNKIEAGFALFGFMKKLGLDTEAQTTTWGELRSTETDCMTPLLHAAALIEIIGSAGSAMTQTKRTETLNTAEEALKKSAAICPGNRCDSQDLIGSLQEWLRIKLDGLKGKAPAAKPAKPDPAKKDTKTTKTTDGKKEKSKKKEVKDVKKEDTPKKNKAPEVVPVKDTVPNPFRPK